MLYETHHHVPSELIEKAQKELLDVDFKLSLNIPTGDYYYDKWVIKNEYVNTVWEELLNTLPIDFGEARLIRLTPGQAYRRHCDMDDRYHLNITGDHSYLIDLDNEKMYSTNDKSRWYWLNAGIRHSAVNFNRTDRIQLVVRQLFNINLLKNNINVTIVGKEEYGTSIRYYFDNILSSWLNEGNKLGYVNKFTSTGDTVNFDVEEDKLPELIQLCDEHFKLCINS